MTHSEIPLWLTLARNELGVKEVRGTGSNPVVVKYFADASHSEIRDDETPWCAAFVGAMLHRANIKPSGSLMARSYLKYGKELSEPRIGAIAIFPRSGDPSSGHVAFVDAVSDDGATISVLGGNQHDCVCVVHRKTSEALAFHYPNNVVPFPLPPQEEHDTDFDEPEDEAPAEPEAPAFTPVEDIPPTSIKPEETRLRAEGSRTISAQDKIENATATMTVVTALMASFKELFELVGPLLVVALVAYGGYVLYQTQQTKKARAEDALTGKHIGR